MPRQLNTISSIIGAIHIKNTVKNVEFVLYRFTDYFKDRDLNDISKNEVLAFLSFLGKVFSNFSEQFFKIFFSIKDDFHIVRVVQVLNQRRIGRHCL